MANKPNSKQVPMNTAEVPQRKRMAAGVKVTGQTTPSASAGNKKPVTKPGK